MLAGAGAVESGAVGDCARGNAVAIDAVGSGAENGDIFAGYFSCAGQCKLLVASSDAAVGDFDCDLASGNQADPFGDSFRNSRNRSQQVVRRRF